jgi:hypothetical protein
LNRTALALWVVGLVAVAVVAGALGQRQANARRGEFYDATVALSTSARARLEAAPAFAAANAVWAFGGVETVRKMLKAELDRIPETDGANRARAFVRFGIIDTNPDGQAALFALACTMDENDCDHLKEAAERETNLRLVAPGNQLPPYFIAGHPHVTGL